MSAGKEGAQVKRRPRGRWPDLVDPGQVVAMAKAGLSPTEIAKQLSRTPSRIRQILLAAGVRAEPAQRKGKAENEEEATIGLIRKRLGEMNRRLEAEGWGGRKWGEAGGDDDERLD